MQAAIRSGLDGPSRTIIVEPLEAPTTPREQPEQEPEYAPDAEPLTVPDGEPVPA